jgi:hypothetical protein
MILIEGEYNGVLTPGLHYLPLAADFSNLDEILRAFADDELRARITTRAFDDIIASGRWSHRAFFADFDRELEAPFPGTRRARQPLGPADRARLARPPAAPPLARGDRARRALAPVKRAYRRLVPATLRRRLWAVVEGRLRPFAALWRD